MPKIDDGGWAFPQHSRGDVEYCGMTYRQWLAGMAMQGFCGNPNINFIKDGYGPTVTDSLTVADAMIKQLKKAPKVTQEGPTGPRQDG